MKNSTKKWLTIAGCLAVCAVLVVVIASRFAGETVTDGDLPSSSSQQGDVVVDPDSGTLNTDAPDNSEQAGDDVTVNPQIPSGDLSENSGNGADSTGTEQTIQADPVKPETPDEEVLTDPSQKPDGTPVEGTPTPENHDTYEPPKEVPQDSSEPQGGDVNSAGQTYLPGFGWIDSSGENQAIQADDMYENGNKIGIMD